MIYIGIDPGPKYTAIVELRDGEVIDAQKLDNDEVLHRLQHYYSRWVARCNQFCFTCEMIASYGMAVGAEVFEPLRSGSIERRSGGQTTGQRTALHGQPRAIGDCIVAPTPMRHG